jgi:hypothetical protein
VKEVLLLGVPALMIVIGSITLVAWFLERQRSVTARGVVKRFTSSVDSEGDPVYRAVIAFEVGGESIEAIDSYGMGWKWYRAGHQVTVRFPPGEPAKLRIVQSWLPWLYLAIILTGAGTLALSVGRL